MNGSPYNSHNNGRHRTGRTLGSGSGGATGSNGSHGTNGTRRKVASHGRTRAASGTSAASDPSDASDASDAASALGNSNGADPSAPSHSPHPKTAKTGASGHNGGHTRAEARTMVMPAERYKDPEAPAAPHPGTGSAGDRTDEQLLGDYRHGDKGSFGQLVNRYQRELYHFLVRFLGNRASAEDVFQETFLQVHQSAEQFDPQRRFRPWLFTIAANKARDLIRSQARRPANPLQAQVSPGDDESGEFIDLMQSASDLPGEPMEKEELQRQVQDTVGGMPEHLREILLLSYFHQFPYKQISEILDIPLGTVKSRLHAAVAHFADRWRSVSDRSERESNQRRPSA